MVGYFEILAGFIVLLLLYHYLTASFNFWKKRDVPGPKPELLFGTTRDIELRKVLFGKYVKHLYDTYENTSFIGIFKMREPILIVKDPKFIKDILIKDSSVFSSRGLTACENAEPMNRFLFFMDGPMAQIFRKKTSPFFTSSKLKEMFHLTRASLERIENYMNELLLKNNCVNCNDLSTRITIDIVGGVIGLDMQTLTNNTSEKCEFLTYSADIRGTNFRGRMRVLMKEYLPQLYNLIGYYILGNAELMQFYATFLSRIVEHRKKHGIVKTDLINSLIELKEDPGQLAEMTDVTDYFLIAQVFGFFFAAFETSAITIANVLYELALYQNIQDKLREEIQKSCSKNTELQYEIVNAMPYLNAVIKETLRKYSVAEDLQRISVSSYTFRNTKLTIPKGQKVVIPLYAIHNDPKIYPNPEVFDPERFIDKATQLRDPMHYIPFGHGFRNCIGERSGILQVKIGLIGILRNYKLDICEQTPASYKYETKTFINNPAEPIFLKMTKIS